MYKFEYTGRVYHLQKTDRGYFFLLENQEGTKSVKCFYPKKTDIAFKEKDVILVKGSLKNEVILAIEITTLKDLFLEDKIYKFKELFVCTKMSFFDSIIDLNFLFFSLNNKGYTHVGIADSNNLCSWKEAEKLSIKYNIKVVYGVQFDVFVDKQNIFRYLTDENIKIRDIKFIVLDIESNGLYFGDFISEIAWSTLYNGNLGEIYSSLIYNDQDVRKEIEKITNINKKMMLEHGKPLDEVLLHLYNTLKEENTILITQNKFDIKILRYHFKKILNIDFKPEYIDNKELIGLAFPEKRKMSLGNICKELNIDVSVAHRAKDDAVNTSLVVQAALERLDINNNITFKEIKNKYVPFTYQQTFKVFVFAKNKEGKDEIFRLFSLANKFFHKFPRLPISELISSRENLILVANSNREGELFQRFFFDFVDMTKIFDFYDYIQLLPFESLMNSMYERNNLFDIESYFIEVEGIKDFYKTILTQENKVVASSVPLYHFPFEFELSKMLKSFIPTGFGKKIKNDKRFFRTFSEMLEVFSFLTPELTQKILKINLNHLVNEISYDDQLENKNLIKIDIENIEIKFKELLLKNIKNKYGATNNYLEQRLTYEFDIIKKNGFLDIYYIVSVFLDYLRIKYKIIFGSRGSIGCSFIAFLLNITEVNPFPPHEYCNKCFYFKLTDDLQSGFDNEKILCECGEKLYIDGHNIMFEIFSGFDGKKVPDIDINVPSKYQEIIHDEAIEFFAKFNLSLFRCGMFGKLQEKNSFFYLKRHLKEKEIEMSQNMIDLYAYKLIGVKLSNSKHPGGLIIIPTFKSIYEITPLQYTDKTNKNNLVTHFDHHMLSEEVFKLDLLAHDDPVTLQSLVEDTGVNIEDIKFNDKNIMALFSGENKLESLALPEFGTLFVRKILTVCKIKVFSELTRISGVTHGINLWTNNGENLITQNEFKLSEIICVRDDIFDFLFKYTKNKEFSFKWMEFVRKGNTKTNLEEFNEFLKEVDKYNLPEWFVHSISKIAYLFPRSHAVAYVIMAFRISYFKLYYPLEFYKSYLNRKIEFIDESMIFVEEQEAREFLQNTQQQFIIDNKDKNIFQIYEVILEMKDRGIKFSNIDVNKSETSTFSFDKKTQSIVPPLNIIKGVGLVVANNIIKQRQISPFINTIDLQKRCKVNNTQIKLLKKLGALGTSDVTQTSLSDLMNEE